MDVSISNLRLKQANIQLKDTKKEASSQIKTKLAELRNALQLLQTAEQAYKFRREELRLKTDAFENGLISYNDYSSVQEKNLDTETSLVKARANIIIKQYELKNLIAEG